MANYTEMTVALFGIPTGGYESVVQTYYNTYGEVPCANWLGSLLPNIYGAQANTNSGIATLIASNLVGNTVTTTNKNFLVNYITTQLNNGIAVGTVVDSLINIIDSIPSTDPNWGNASAQFTNKVAVATFYAQIGGSATNIQTLDTILPAVSSAVNTVTSSINQLSLANQTAVDIYVQPSSFLNSGSFVHSSSLHDNIFVSTGSGYNYYNYSYAGYIDVAVTNNTFSQTSFYSLATSNYNSINSVTQFSDGNMLLASTSYYSSDSVYYYTPGSSTYSMLSIVTGNTATINGVSLLLGTDALLYGNESTVLNASMDGYLVVTNQTAGVLNEVRIENMTSNTSSVNIDKAWAFSNGAIVAHDNSTNNYLLLNSSLTISEVISFTSLYQTMTNLKQLSDGTYLALNGQNIDHFSANFNVLSTLNISITGIPSYLINGYGESITFGNGHLYALDNINGKATILEFSGTTAGSTITQAIQVTNSGQVSSFAHMTYDNGLLYLKPSIGANNMLILNPSLQITGNPSGVYKANSVAITGSLVQNTANPDGTITINGSGIYQTHTDLHLLGVATGSAQTMNHAGLFTTGSL